MDAAVIEQQMRDALAAHEGWKTKLSEAAASGSLPKPAREISCDDQCAFGKWLHKLKHDPAVGGAPAFQAVMDTHAEFHRIAGGIAALVEQGRGSEASSRIAGPEFTQTSQRLKADMMLWRRKLGA